MKKLVLLLSLFLFVIFLSRVSSSIAAQPLPTPSATPIMAPGPNPGPPLGIPCGNTMCLEGEICMQYPGDIDLHCVAEEATMAAQVREADVIQDCWDQLGKNEGVFPPNTTCWNHFTNAQKDISLYERTCIYYPVVTYEETRFLDGPQGFLNCGKGNSGLGGPPAPGGDKDECGIAMLVYTDVRESELGSYGPSAEAIKDNSIDFLAQNYLYNSLFDRPLNLSDKNREAYRTYWRLMPAANQANLRSFILNSANEDQIENINFTYTDSYGNRDKKTDFKSLYSALKEQVILFWHFPFIRIGCLVQYPVCPEYAQATKELRLDAPNLLEIASQLDVPGAEALINVYLTTKARFGNDLASPYDAFVPLDHSSVRSYIVKKKDEDEEFWYAYYDRYLKDGYVGVLKPKLTNVSGESMPYIGSIYQGLLSPKFGMLPALQPSWVTEKYTNEGGLSDYKLGNKPEDLPEVAISRKNLLARIAEEAVAFVDNPFGWISEKFESIFTDEFEKKGYTKIGVDNTKETVREAYENKICPLPLSYHVLGPQTAAINIDSPTDKNHHQVVFIKGNQLAWNYDPEHRPLWREGCEPIRNSAGVRIGQTCGLIYNPCPSGPANYIEGDQCYTRRWQVSGVKDGKSLTVTNNPKQSDIDKAVADESEYAFYDMMLPDNAGRLKPPQADIDAPIAKHFISFQDGGGSLQAVAPSGEGTVLNPVEPINRSSNLAQDSMHYLQNCWVVPDTLQNSPRCDYTFTPEPDVESCSGEKFKEILAQTPQKPSSKAQNYFDTNIKARLTPELITAYTAAEEQTGVPCEVLAGIHFEEADNDPTKDLQSGAPLGHKTLETSAIEAAEELKGKAGGNITNLNQLIQAMSWYNGGGNSNCQAGNSYSCATTDRCGETVDCAADPSACRCIGGPAQPGSCRATCTQGFPYQFTYNFCPPLTGGYDDPYVTNWWLSPQHDNMYLLFMYDCTQTRPQIHERPGSLTVALMVYLSQSQ